MKKFTRILALVAGVSIMLLSGCNSAVSDAVVDDANKKTETDRQITFNITSNSNLINFSENASEPRSIGRTIIPTAYTCSDLWFYYTYKNITSGGDESTATAIEVTGTDKTGTVVINLDAAQYEFKMYAVKKGEAETEAPATMDTSKTVLQGSASADIRTSDNVNFFLTAEGINNTGTVALKLYTKGWELPSGYDVKADLTYTKADATHEIDSTVNNTTVTYPNATFKAAISTETAVNYKPKDESSNPIPIAPGTYNFTVYYEDTVNSNEYVWSDRIIILPGQETAVTIGLPNVIGTIPTKPASLNVTYIDPDNSSTGYYTAQFNWADSSNNEKFFELQVLEFKANEDSTIAQTDTDTNWNNLYTTKSALVMSNIIYGTSTAEVAGVTGDDTADYKVFYGQPESGYIAGALTKNNTVAIMYLSLGSRYVARIRAVNAGGASQWTYAGTSTATTANNSTGLLTANAFTSSTINRYRVTYELAGGSFVDDTDNPLTNQPTTVYYYCQNSTAGNSIMRPNGSGSFEGITNPLIKYNNKIWSSWKSEFDNIGASNASGAYHAVADAPLPYKGCGNITLTASYATVGSVTLFDDNSYKIGAITSSITASDAFTTDDSGISIVQTVAENAGTALTWEIAFPRAKAYENIKIQIVATDKSRSYMLENPTYDDGRTKATFTIPYATYGEGIYNAKILAYTKVKPNDPYQKTIVLNITQSN